MEDNKINIDDLANVTAGTKEQIEEIISTFRKYGFNSEADKLAKGGVIFFNSVFERVMKGLGYKQELTLYASDEGSNYNIYNGNLIGHVKFMDILDEFLYRKANNIPFE